MPRARGIRRILCVRTDRLGETILTLPAIFALARGLPAAEVTALVHPSLKPLLEAWPGFSGVLADDPDDSAPWWRRAMTLARRLRPQQHDLAVVFNPKKELHAAVRLAGIRERVGYARKWGWLLTKRVPDAKALGARHEVEYNLDLVRAAGVPAASPTWEPARLERERADVRGLLREQGIRDTDAFLVVHPWASTPRKQWALERYRALIAASAARPGLGVVVVGAAEERPRGQALVPAGAAVANLIGRLTLIQLAAVLKEARLLVGNDSGPMHLAAALGTRVVALFGTEDPAAGPVRWGPWGAGHQVISKPSMEAISVDEVWTAVGGALA